MKNGLLRQGDVMLVKVRSVPKGAKFREADKKRGVVLAEGEVTGHAHTLPSTTVKEYVVPAELGDADRFIVVDKLSQLVHQEHAAIDVTPGTYKVIRQREYSPVAIRNVAD